MGIDEAYIWMERDCWKERIKLETKEQRSWTFYKPHNDKPGFYEIHNSGGKPVKTGGFYLKKYNNHLEIYLGTDIHKLSFQNEDTMVWDLGEKILDRIINKN